MECVLNIVTIPFLAYYSLIMIIIVALPFSSKNNQHISCTHGVIHTLIFTLPSISCIAAPQRSNMPMICDPFTTNPYPTTQPTAPKPAAAQPPTAKPLLAASKSQPAKPIARPKTSKPPQSPTQIEQVNSCTIVCFCVFIVVYLQSFLGGNGVDEELDSEYYNIPVEENVLDDSLNSSSNSSSLCPAPRDANGTGVRRVTIMTLCLISVIYYRLWTFSVIFAERLLRERLRKCRPSKARLLLMLRATRQLMALGMHDYTALSSALLNFFYSSLSIVPKNRPNKLNGLSCSPPNQVSPLVTEKKIAANKSPSKHVQHNGRATEPVDGKEIPKQKKLTPPSAAPTRRRPTYDEDDEDISPPSKQRSLPPPSAAPTRHHPTYYEDDEEPSKQKSLPPAPTRRQPTYYEDDEEITPPSKQRSLPPAPTRRQPTYYEDDEEITPPSKQRSLPPAPTRRQPTYYEDDEEIKPPSKPKKNRRCPPPSAAPTKQSTYGSDNDCTYHEDEEPKRPNAALTRQAAHVSVDHEVSESKKIMPSKLPIKKKMLSASLKTSSADPNQGKTATQRKPVNLANSTSAPLNRQGHQYDDNDDGLEILTPVQHPEQELRAALKTLGGGGEDWEHKCYCLVIMRRLAAHHRHLLLGQLHSVTMVVEKEVSSETSLPEVAIINISLNFR